MSRKIGRHRAQFAPTLVLPRSSVDPIWAVLRRLLLAFLLISFVAIWVRLDNNDYRDSYDTGVSLLDAFYYATVSVTTTGYGDIVPTANGARLFTTVVVTFARVAFLILLVGTTVEVATQKGREAISQRRWRKRVKDHTIVCGYGTKGRSAVKTLIAQGHDPKDIVVIDPNRQAVDEATSAGLAGVVGSATRARTLEQAEVHEARAVIVAPDDDASAVLMTLTAREMNPNVIITSAVRESDNAHLLRQGGANSVVVSSEAAGRLLGVATTAPRLVEVLEDLLTAGSGMDLAERPPRPDEIGNVAKSGPSEVVIAVLRGGEVFHPTDVECSHIESTDTIVVLLPSN
jgi:voltage-gated potassium channel